MKKGLALAAAGVFLISGILTGCAKKNDLTKRLNFVGFFFIGKHPF